MRATTAARRLLVAGVCLSTALILTLTLAACGSAGKPSTAKPSSSPATRATASSDAMTTPDLDQVSMKPPGKLTKPLLSPDVLILSQDTLPDAVVKAIGKVKGVTATELMSMSQFFVEEQGITFAAVHPDTFRRFTPQGSAQTEAVWDRVSDGEMAMAPALGKALQNAAGYVRLGNDEGAPDLHIGAYAEMVPRRVGRPAFIDAVVNEKWVPRLKMTKDNAMLLDTGVTSPAVIQKQLLALVGSRGSVQILAQNLNTDIAQTAILTGGSVARAVGSFTYTVNRDGTVNPDQRWVSNYIRTEQVPILGPVRCNKAMLPQLRAALVEVIDRGLGPKISKAQYGGCYVPRYIARDPSKGLSFHTFGTAIDLNVPGNQRGTVGAMDRSIVSIFQKWGFNWGGYWNYTDPMHFEMARIVKVR